MSAVLYANEGCSEKTNHIRNRNCDCLDKTGICAVCLRFSHYVKNSRHTAYNTWTYYDKATQKCSLSVGFEASLWNKLVCRVACFTPVCPINRPVYRICPKYWDTLLYSVWNFNKSIWLPVDVSRHRLMCGKQCRPWSDAAFAASDLGYTVCPSLPVRLRKGNYGRPME